MHFRYIEIELLFPAAALGFAWQQTQKRWLKYGLCAALAVFSHPEYRDGRSVVLTAHRGRGRTVSSDDLEKYDAAHAAEMREI